MNEPVESGAPQVEPQSPGTSEQESKGLFGKIKEKLTHKKTKSPEREPEPSEGEHAPPQPTSEEQPTSSESTSFKAKVKEKVDRVEEFLHLKKKDQQQ
jgi:hypothetical protein